MTGQLGEVALKVLRGGAMPVHAFELHREAQWSLTRLHLPSGRDYDNQAAELFARCLEDHSGFGDDLSGQLPVARTRASFDAERRQLEAADFDWSTMGLKPSRRPYD